MKRFPLLLAATIAFVPVLGHAAQTAQARMVCFSPRFQRAMDQNDLFSMDMTTLNAGVNGELAFYDFFGTAYSHSTFLILIDQLFGDKYDGQLAIDVPNGGDGDGDGYYDFYEVARAVNANSTGVYNINGIGSGGAAASWSRAADSQYGSCVLTLQMSSFGNLVFVCTFELIEYKGPLLYTPGSNTVSGSVDLAQTGNMANQMQGPVQFVKVATNRFNMLTLQPGTWTNNAMQSLTFTNDLYSRESPWLTNYFGYFDFDDWDPNTTEIDYNVWLLSIDDTNDVNHNMIPDFSDDPASALPRRPALSLTSTTTNVLLTIHGDVGHLHKVQEATVLNPVSWPTVLSVTLTNDPQVVALPKPATGAKFWRVQAQ